MTEQTFEELVAHVASLTDELNKTKAQVKSFVAQEDEKDDDTKTAFLKAQEDMKEKEKEATMRKATEDKIKEAFKIAEEETDPEKKKEAMKKAMEMKEDEEKKDAKKATSEEEKPKDNVEAAKIAALENEIANPIRAKILQAQMAIDPQGAKALEKKLKTASLSEVKAMWEDRKPFVAALGLETSTPQNGQGFIPFQAATAFGEESSETDFSKMDSEKLLSEMYR